MFYDDNLTEIFEKYDIPISKKTVEAVHSIVCWVKYEIDWDKLVSYLKDRSTRDIYNREPNHPEFREDTLEDWVFYLVYYGEYIDKILIESVPMFQRKKYLYPKDVFDIVYQYRNNKKVKYFFNYMREKRPESTWDLCPHFDGGHCMNLENEYYGRECNNPGGCNR